MTKKLTPVHPGRLLEKDFLRPLGLSGYRLARAIHVPAIRVSEIIRGKRGISVDTAWRLSCFFGVSPDFWLRLQNRNDLDVLEDQGENLPRIIPLEETSRSGGRAPRSSTAHSVHGQRHARSAKGRLRRRA
jgi:addiction module HigA family antidote